MRVMIRISRVGSSGSVTKRRSSGLVGSVSVACGSERLGVPKEVSKSRYRWIVASQPAVAM